MLKEFNGCAAEEQTILDLAREEHGRLHATVDAAVALIRRKTSLDYALKLAGADVPNLAAAVNNGFKKLSFLSTAQLSKIVAEQLIATAPEDVEIAQKCNAIRIGAPKQQAHHGHELNDISLQNAFGIFQFAAHALSEMAQHDVDYWARTTPALTQIGILKRAVIANSALLHTASETLKQNWSYPAAASFFDYAAHAFNIATASARVAKVVVLAATPLQPVQTLRQACVVLPFTPRQQR